MLLIRHWELSGLLKRSRKSGWGATHMVRYMSREEPKPTRGRRKSWRAFSVPGSVPSAPQRHSRQLELVLLEGDGFELPVREHHAMAPSHGFAATSHREAALRGAPASHGETAFVGKRP